ncbi:response regulator transcription factor [Elusimicrobiota bacterium]
MDNKILVVDDEFNIVELLKVNLEAEGFSVIGAYDGMQAVKYAHSEKPDLIILDIMLPAGSGYTVLERLNSSADTNLIPVIAMSGFSKDDLLKKIPVDKIHIGNKKIRGFIKKPFDIESAVQKIKGIFSQR